MRFLVACLSSSLLLAACGDDDGLPAQDAGPDGQTGNVPTRLDPSSLDKFVDPIARPVRIAAFNQDGSTRKLTIGMYEIHQKLSSQLPATQLYGYGPSADEASYPGPTLDARPGFPTEVKWQNKLPDNHFLPIDTTIHWADPPDFPGAGVPTVVHVHGGLQESASDGHPDAWFTHDFDQTGPAFVKKTYHYTNDNLPETLWYHDHALGLTRLNVYAGLAGFYLLRDPNRDQQLGLPSGEQELEIVVQDRSFMTDGSLFYPDMGNVPDIHPQWVPEFFGDVNVVNGVVWPYMEVEPKRYRFRFLDGANARFYNLSLSDGRPFTKIGTSGGFLSAPVELQQILVAPGERADVIVDFSDLSAGDTVELRNDAATPYPNGDPVDDNTAAVMQFRVVAQTSPDDSVIPPQIDNIPVLSPQSTRTMTLVEVLDDQGQSTGLFLNGRRWGNPGDVRTTPTVGSTEVWELVNLTGDAHPIHVHLIDFQVLDRQDFDADAYNTDYAQLNPTIPAQDTKTLDVGPYLQGDPQPPPPNDAGWKDTVIAPPGQVTRFVVRWQPEAGGDFPFDATSGPGYVWHCHILEHEDNEMMQRLELVAP